MLRNIYNNDWYFFVPFNMQMHNKQGFNNQYWMSEVCQMRFLKAHIHTKKSVIIICFLRQSVFEVPAKEKLNCFGWWQVLLLLLPYLLFMKSILQFPYSSVPNSHLDCKVAAVFYMLINAERKQSIHIIGGISDFQSP